MSSSDVTLLYSVKDEAWKNYLSDQLENNAVNHILITHEPLEHLTWPLEPDKKKSTETRQVLVLLSSAFLDFLEKHIDYLLEIKNLLTPEKTIGVLFGLQRENLKHFHDDDFSWDDWSIIPQEDMEKIIHTVQELLEQSEKKEAKSKPSFKLVPRKVYEGKGRVYIILDEPLEEGQELKIFSKGSVITEINVKKINSYNWQFLVSDSYMRNSSILKVGISCNGDIIGSQTLKCESRLCQLYNLLSASCGPAELMCDALGVNSYDALDRMLARAFKKRFPQSEICELYLDENTAGYTQAKQEIPTLVHFAARYGFTHLVKELLHCPGSYSACNMKNAQGLTPAELASYFKHHDLSIFLKDFQNLKCTRTTWNNSLNNLSAPSLSPNLLSSVSIDATDTSEHNKNISSPYAIPSSEKIEYDYIDEHQSANDRLALMPGSVSPTSETLFIESQLKLVEINEAYKKGATEHEVLSMFDKWQSTYQVDLEAKRKLEDLRNLYAKKNKSKLNKKHSANFSDFKQLLSKILPRRKDSTDSQDAGNNSSSQEVRCNFVKDKDSKSHYRRLSKTFSTTSYASASSSSSSDHLSVASEHSDYHEFITSFKNHPGMCSKSPVFNITNSANYRKSSAPLLLPRSPQIHPPQNFSSAFSKKETSDYNGSSQHHNSNHQNEFDQLPAFESIRTFQSNSYDTEGYDVLPLRAPLLVQPTSVGNHISRSKDSVRQKNTQSCVSSFSTDYDIPKSPVPAWGNKSTDLDLSYTEIPCASARYLNGAVNHNATRNYSLTGFRITGNIEQQPVYGNISFKEDIARRNSIPDEIAPAPPLLEEEEYYKFVGVPIPIANAK